MKLVAGLIVRNELSRYLEPCIGHLLEFVDEIRIVDDRSDDGTWEWLRRQDRVEVAQTSGRFFDHEGAARQELLEWTLAGDPTHVLAIDADEFVSDGRAIRRICEAPRGEVWTLSMLEIWKAFPECLCVRMDGGWRPGRSPILWRVPDNAPDLRIKNLALACGREPEYVRRLIQRDRVAHSGVDVLHFGWANELERQARYDRYVVHDGGKFHRSQHLGSIIWPDEKVEMDGQDWPPALEKWRPTIVAKGGR